MSKYKILSVGVSNTDNLGDVAIMTMIRGMFTDSGYQVEKMNFNFRAVVENVFPFTTHISNLNYFKNKYLKFLFNAMKYILYFPIIAIVFLRKSKGCSKVFIGGGNVLMGIEYGFPIQALTYVLLSRALGKHVSFICVGVGPFSAPGVRLILSYALKLSDQVICRDSSSRQLIENEFGPDFVKLKVLADPVLLWPKILSQKGCQYDVLINVLPLFSVSLFPDGNKQKEDNFTASVVELIVELLKADLTVGLFVTDVDADSYISKQVIDAVFIETGSKLLLHIPNIPDELASLVNLSNVVVSSRMHGAILSLSQHTPVLCLNWQPKIQGLYSDIQMEYFLINLDKEGMFSIGDVISKISEINTNRAFYVKEISLKLDNIRSQYSKCWTTL